jgi:Xaa-Pro aminopeptidase
MDYRARLQRVRQELQPNRLDALLVTHLPNVQYLCGFTGSSGALLIAPKDCLFFTDGRYSEQAGQEVEGASIQIIRESLLSGVGKRISRRSRQGRVGIEASYVTMAQRRALLKAIANRAKLIEAPPMIERLRMIKDSGEVARIRAACRLGVQLFERLLKVICPGATEGQVAGELEFGARKMGAEQMAFPTIIAGGRRSALPHGRASHEVLPRRGFVVCDFGVILTGYCSDMTRTVHLGRPQAEAQRGYEAVQDAQCAALETVKPGIAVSEVDHAARKLLKNKRLDKFFTHSTGHGLGLEIHESPRIAARQREILEPGMVVTIEPGIYLPGKWGVRIEDTVVVTKTGCEILTPCPKDLITV